MTKFLDSTGLSIVLKNLRSIFNEKAMFSSYNGGNNIVLYNKNDNNISYSYLYSNSYVDTMITTLTTSYNNLKIQYDDLLDRVKKIESSINNTSNSYTYLGETLQTIATVNGVEISAGVHDIEDGTKNTADTGEIETVYGILYQAGFKLD